MLGPCSHCLRYIVNAQQMLIIIVMTVHLACSFVMGVVMCSSLIPLHTPAPRPTVWNAFIFPHNTGSCLVSGREGAGALEFVQGSRRDPGRG